MVDELVHHVVVDFANRHGTHIRKYVCNQFPSIFISLTFTQTVATDFPILCVFEFLCVSLEGQIHRSTQGPFFYDTIFIPI